MGGTDSKEENNAQIHGNSLLTVIESQSEHTGDHKEQFNLLVAIVCLLLIVIVGQCAKMVLHCLKKKWIKKGLQSAASMASIANV